MNMEWETIQYYFYVGLLIFFSLWVIFKFTQVDKPLKKIKFWIIWGLSTIILGTAILVLLSIYLINIIFPSTDKQPDLKNAPTIDSYHENTMVYNPINAIWICSFDTLLKDFKPIKLRNINRDTLTPQKIEDIINKNWPKVQIKYLSTSIDTIFLSIPHSEVLTQQMGSSGADQFMVSTTYTFTELKGIKYVSYEFEFGDHANPGVYCRSSWTTK
ncbi:hypothetical protein FLAV_00888 [Flavobacteriales bacterium]|nr:hypothetical protein FLAV_00888 [Flavobacteriales bacterium]